MTDKQIKVAIIYKEPFEPKTAEEKYNYDAFSALWEQMISVFINDEDLSPVATDSKDAFSKVLEENWQAQIAGYYNCDKTDEERKIRTAVIEEYKDLIVLYKKHLAAPAPKA